MRDVHDDVRRARDVRTCATYAMSRLRSPRRMQRNTATTSRKAQRNTATSSRQSKRNTATTSRQAQPRSHGAIRALVCGWVFDRGGFDREELAVVLVMGVKVRTRGCEGPTPR